MRTVVASIKDRADEVIRENADKHLERFTYIFEQVLWWKSVTYKRFLYHVISIRREMNPGSQLDTWVRLQTLALE